MVSEELYNRKIREIEHLFRVTYTRHQKMLWFTRIRNWDEEVFALACERFVTSTEQRWEVRDGNLLAQLRNLTQTESAHAAERDRVREWKRNLEDARRRAEPPSEAVRNALRRLLNRLGMF